MADIDWSKGSLSGPDGKPVDTTDWSSGVLTEPPKPAGAIRRIADQGIKLAQGVVGVPEAAVGVADLVTGGRAGKLAESAGVRFKDAKQIMGEYLSPEQKAADQEVAQADGFLPTIGAMVRNPSTIAGSVMESAPSMIGGGAAARGLLKVAPKLGAIAAGAAGEGLVSAGQNAEQVRQESPTGLLTPEQSAVLAASGALTGGISLASGRLANKLGIGDVQTMLASGKAGVVGEEAAKAAAGKGVVRKLAEGMANEGVLQELPQSYQEQVAQNIAQGKPWDEGAAKAGAQGMLAGAVMGGGANVVSHVGETAPVPEAAPEPAAPALQIGNTPDPYLSFPDGTVARRSEIDAYINGLPADQQPAARAKAMGLAPQPGTPEPVVKPSEAMGLDPAAGPMSAAAVTAVDTGAHQEIQLQQASEADQAAYQQATAEQDRQAAELDTATKPITHGPIAEAAMSDEDKRAVLFSNQAVADGGKRYAGTLDGDILNGLGKPYPNRLAAARRANMEGKDWTIAQVQDGFVARRKDANGQTNGVQSADPGVVPAGRADSPASVAPGPVDGSGAGAKQSRPVAGVLGQSGELPKRTDAAPVASGRAQPTTLGTQTTATAGPGFTAKDVTRVQNAAPRANTTPAAPAVETSAVVESNAAASEGLPNAGSATVEGAGVDQTTSWTGQASQDKTPQGATQQAQVNPPSQAAPLKTVESARSQGTVRQSSGQSSSVDGTPSNRESQSDDQKRAKAIERIAKGSAYFSNGLKAQQFIAQNGLKDTHQAVKTSATRWDVKSKVSQPQEQTSAKAPKAVEATAQQQAAGPATNPAKPAASDGVAAATEAKPAAAPVANPGLERMRRARAAKQTEPTAKKPNALRQRVEQAMQARADYFTPGNIVESWAGHNRVVSYTAPDKPGGDWSVTVRAVEKKGGKWVDVPRERDRKHSIQPEPGKLKVGPVERASGLYAQSAGAAEVVLSGEEIAPLAATGKDLRTLVSNWTRARWGSGASFDNRNSKATIEVVWQSLKHAISNANEPELRLLAGLPQMLESAAYIGQSADKAARPDIKAVHSYSAVALLNGERLDVGIVVRETKDGHRFYDHFILKNKNPSGISGAASSTKADGLGDQPAEGSAGSIAPAEPEVKGKPTAPRDTPSAKSDRIDDFGEKLKTDMGVAMFSRGEQASTGLTPDQFTSELTKAFGPKVAERLQAQGIVVPVADKSKIPGSVSPFLRDGDKVYGFYDPSTNRTYAVLENLKPDMVKGVVLHEVGVHFGFEGLLGIEKYAQVMKRVNVMRLAGNKAVLAAYAEAKQNAAHASQVGEETIAYLVQRNQDMGLVREIIARIKAFLYEKFGIGGDSLNEADLTMLARAAVLHATRTGEGKGLAPAFVRGTNEAVTKSNDVNQGGRSADDTTPEHVNPVERVKQAARDAFSIYQRRTGAEGDAASFEVDDNDTPVPFRAGAVAQELRNLGWEIVSGDHAAYASNDASQYFDVRKQVSDDTEDGPEYVTAKVRVSNHGNTTKATTQPNVNIAPGEDIVWDIEEKLNQKITDEGYDLPVNAPSDARLGYAIATEQAQRGKPSDGSGGNTTTNEPTAPDSGGAMFSRTQIVGQTNRQHTPEQLRAMANVGFQVEVPTLKERAQALWKDAGKKMAQGIVDQFAPVKALDKDAYGLLRLAKGASGAFEAFLRGGRLKLTNGVYDFDDANKGGVVDKLLIPLQGEHHDFFRWVAANRAERLTAEGKENLFSPQDIADLKTLADGTTDFDYTIKTGPGAGRVTRDRTLIYADANRVFNEFNTNVLDLAEQSGLIDGASRKVWEHEFYVPFYRVADEDTGGVRGMSVKGSVLRQQAFKELKGGKNALNADLLDNTLMNWAHLLDASAKNRAAKATIEAAERMGIATGGNQSTLASMGASIHNKHGVVWFMDGGQKRYSLIDNTGDGPYLMTAINALEYAGMRNPVMNAMGTMKHVLTVGVTASPFFKVRNLIRDSVQVIGTSGINPNAASNIGQGWKLTDPKSDAYFRLLAGGGTIHFGTMLEGSEAKRVQALVESGVDDATILNSEHKVKAFYRKFIEPGITAYNELGNRGEAVNRAALYDQLRKQGMNHADASLQARDLMDFSMQGSFTSIRFLTQVVPFFNARIQGLYKLGRAAKEDPARFSAVVGAAAVVSLSLLAMFGDDDDWKKREEWDRNNFWWFKFGGMAFRIPKPFEIGAIATLAERGFELAFDKEMTGERFRKQVLTLLGDNLSMNPVPQLVKPIMDVYANKDSFSGRPIETMGMDKLKSEYRFTDRTSMTARAASTSLNAVTGLVGAEALSPVQIDHMLRGYFGWLGAFVVGTGDKLARPAMDQPGRATPDYWKTATGGMVSDLRDAPSRYVSQMYEQAKELEQAYGTWRALQKEGKTLEAHEFAQDNRDKLAKYRRVEAVRRAEAKFNQRIRMIERSGMDGDAKRESIRKIQVQKDQIARQVAG